MRRINIRHFLTGTLLLLLSVCMALAAWAEAPITFTDKNLIVVTFTFSKNSYALGSEIAVKYSISGGSGKYTFMDYHCYGDDNGSRLYYRGDSTSNVSPSGTIYFTPNLGQKAYVQIGVSDSQVSVTRSSRG